jgi:hypothetical protein
MAKKKPHRSKDRHKPRKMVAVHPALHGVEPVRPAGED